ncbi:MAG TPA: metallophosphoesterase [Vicinamibacterales bacterium]
MRRIPSVVVLLAVVTASLLAAQQAAPLPTRPESLKFAVIGDTGTGEPPQFDVGSRMAEARRTFPFDLVIMLGDNIYGSQTPQDFVTKFQRPYAQLLSGGVLFHATLGNHDAPANRFYPGFNMGGLRYYTYFRKNVQFFVLDSNAMDPQQLAWLDNALKESVHPWKICYFHHPLYSNARRHGSEFELRVVLEPLFVKYGVNVVYSGHDHIYERIKPQKGITYFVNGSSGQLRPGDTRPSATTAAYFDRDQVFSLVEVDGDDLFFQAITRTGRTVDSGVIHRQTALQTR